MGIFLNTNLNSLHAQRQLQSSHQRLKTSFERLSSGVRINGAQDDAAGLSITTRMEAQTREMGRAIHNANDAISLLQTTEGVLNESTHLLQRMRELTVQAGNESNSLADREAIQAEIDQLIQELDRSGKASFNGRTLFGEHYDFFLGSKQNSNAEFSLKTKPLASNRLGRHSTVTSLQAVNTHVTLADGDLTIVTHEGKSVSIFESNPEDDELSTANRAGSAIAKAATINRSAALHGVTAYVGETRLTSTGIHSEQTLEADDYLKINGEVISGFTVSEHDADGVLQEAINALFDKTGVIAQRDAEGELMLIAPDGRNIAIEAQGTGRDLGFGNGAVLGAPITLSSRTYFTLQFDSDNVNFEALGKLADLPPTPAPELVVGPGPVVPIDDVGVFNFFNNDYLPGDINPDGDLLFYDGSIPGNVSISGFYDSSVLGDNQHLMFYFERNNELRLAVLDQDNKIIDKYRSEEAFIGDGTYTFLGINSISSNQDLLADSIFKITLANTANADHGDDFFGSSAFSFRVSGGSLGAGLPAGPPVITQALIGEDFEQSTVQSIDVRSASGIRHALTIIDAGLEELSATRSHLGAKMNRLENSVNHLSQTKSNLTTAQSRIKDTDFALESAQLAQSQIIQQASVSVLAQANTSTQIANTLLSASLA